MELLLPEQTRSGEKEMIFPYPPLDAHSVLGTGCKGVRAGDSCRGQQCREQVGLCLSLGAPGQGTQFPGKAQVAVQFLQISLEATPFR